MYVCICNAVTDCDIRNAARAGCTNLDELTQKTGCGTCCGSCLPVANDLLIETHSAAMPLTVTHNAA